MLSERDSVINFNSIKRRSMISIHISKGDPRKECRCLSKER